MITHLQTPELYIILSSIGHIRKLHSIDLSHNLLINIEQGTFFASKKLQVVYLNNNALSDLNPGLFGNHRQLKIVDLSRNQLSTLPEQLFQRTSLEIFRAAHNRLHEIPIKTLNPVSTSHNTLMSVGLWTFASGTKFVRLCIKSS